MHLCYDASGWKHAQTQWHTDVLRFQDTICHSPFFFSTLILQVLVVLLIVIKTRLQCFLSSLEQNTDSSHALRIIIKRRIHNGFAVAQSQLPGCWESSIDASYLYFLLAHCGGSGAGLFSVSVHCAWGPLRGRISSGEDGSFLGGLPDQMAPTRGNKCPCWAEFASLSAVGLH